MRKNLFVLLAAALMVVTGCKKDDNTAGNDNGAKMTFTATIDNGGSKTTIEGVDMNWTKGDVISINGKDFTADEAGASTTFTGDEVGKKDGKYMAYYLVTMGEGGSLSLPASQTYAGANLAGVNPMYAESTATTLLFHNICALIKLDLKGTGSVKTITASANQPLKGTFEILTNQDGGYYAHATSAADADKSVVLNCGDGVALNGTNATTFYIALPQGEYMGLKLTLSDGTYTYPIEISGNKTLTAGIMYGKEVAGVEFVAPVPEGALKGKFSVSATKQVYFSKGNLQYLANDGSGTFPGQAKDKADAGKSVGGTWRFAENQYDSKASNIMSESQTYGDWIDMFCWSSTGYNHHSKSYYWPWSSATGGMYYANGNISNNLTGKADWGYNKISNGGDAENSGWRTLSQSEWNYLVNTRKINGAPGFGKVTYEGKTGLIIYPDNYSGTMYNEGAALTSETFPDGCVFLPCSGYRNGNSGILSSSEGHYWTTTCESSASKAYLFKIATSGPNANNSDKRGQCRNVRLVRDVPAAN